MIISETQKEPAIFSNLTPAERMADKLLVELSLAISEAREKHDLTQKEFAKKLGVSQAQISKWESFDCNYSVETLARIFDALDATITFQVGKKSTVSTTEYNDRRFHLTGVALPSAMNIDDNIRVGLHLCA